jgi:flagellar hook assembly protein FlgD
MNGKIIELHKGQLGAGVHEFEIDAKKLDLPNGTYSIALSTNKQTIAKTIVKID